MSKQLSAKLANESGHPGARYHRDVRVVGELKEGTNYLGLAASHV